MAGTVGYLYGISGIMGILNDNLFDLGKEDPEELSLMLHTPSSALGSCRYKLKDPDEDETDYLRILVKITWSGRAFRRTCICICLDISQCCTCAAL